MRRLYPDPADRVDEADAYAVPEGQRRHLRANMVSSADGAAVIDGRVGNLTSPADQRLLHHLRGLADVVLVGAGTVRAEVYGPLTMAQPCRRRRSERGQLHEPPLAVVTRGLDLDLGSPLFTDALSRPIVFTTARAPADRLRAAAETADVVVAGDEYVDLVAATDALADRGLTDVLSEGGPRLLADLFAADLVDELCLALSPMVVCGEGRRVTAGPALPAPHGLRLASALEEDGSLFLRYTRPA